MEPVLISRATCELQRVAGDPADLAQWCASGPCGMRPLMRPPGILEDDTAEAFCRNHGFIAFGTAVRQFVLPLESLSREMTRAECR